MTPKMMTRSSAALAAMAALAATPALAQPAGSVTVSGGLDYSSGDYGTGSTTKILVAPFTAAWRNDWLRVSAGVPYLRIDGDAVVLGPDGQPLPGVPGAMGNRAGIGDVSFAATVSVPPESLGGLELDLSGRVKLPTSDEDKALGTGETDFSVAADLSYPVGNWGPFVTLGYRMPGDPEGVELMNSFVASVGTSVILGKTVLIASYDYAEASSPLAEDVREVFAAVNTPLNRRVNATAYGSVGLSDGAPDFGLGVLFTLKFD